jgi:spore maturation protein CgeB
MRVLYLGDIAPGQTCRMRMHAIERLGHEVLGVDTIKPMREASWLQRQIQRRLCYGSVIDEINRSVISTAREFRPEIIWADKQEYLSLQSLSELRSLGARLVHFTPDPYFYLSWKRTRLMDEAMRAFDVHVYCKSYEKADYEALGRQLIYMPLGYCDEVHRPIPSDDPRWQCTVGFLGGWDPHREMMLHGVAATDVDLKIWGGYWDFLRDGKWTVRRRIILKQLAGTDRFKIHRDELLARALQGGEVYGDSYAKALSGSRISIGFLRKVCPDQHTTRTFEIPACRSMLLADRTAEHLEFFEEGKEAEFFSSADELVEKVQYYRHHETEREAIANAGYERCHRSGYSYQARLGRVFAELG